MRLCVVDLCCCGTPITYCYFNDTIRTAKPLQNYLNQHNRIGPVKRGRAKNQPRETPQNFTMQCVYATYPQLHSPITLYHISRVCLFFPNFQHKRKHVRTPALGFALSRTVTGQIFRSTHTRSRTRSGGIDLDSRVFWFMHTLSHTVIADTVGRLLMQNGFHNLHAPNSQRRLPNVCLSAPTKNKEIRLHPCHTLGRASAQAMVLCVAPNRG